MSVSLKTMMDLSLNTTQLINGTFDLYQPCDMALSKNGILKTKNICNEVSWISKVGIFWEGHKILQKIFPLLLSTVQYIQTKVRWRFRKMLWPSQKTWTLFLSFIDLKREKDIVGEIENAAGNACLVNCSLVGERTIGHII